jgi:hypothetical protein
MRSVVGRLSAAVDSQNGIDVASVVALLEAARSSIIGARKAPSPQQFMHRCVACGGGSWLGFEAPWWWGIPCVNGARVALAFSMGRTVTKPFSQAWRGFRPAVVFRALDVNVLCRMLNVLR